MIATFYKPDDSKGLYFNLSSSFQLSEQMNPNKQHKFAGLYAIFKSEKCYYVGQSQNIASRLATHLYGRYETADRVDVYCITQNGFPNFYGLEKDVRARILEYNEKCLIKNLKPIDNIIADYCIEIDENKTDFIDGSEVEPDTRIFVSADKHITVSDYGIEDIMCIDERLTKEYVDEIESVRAATGYKQGVKQ